MTRDRAVSGSVKCFLGIAILLIPVAPASAYSLRSAANGSCAADGSACNVFCNNGDLAGTMFWNGSIWTDGVKSDPDKDAEARKICDANGASCI